MRARILALLDALRKFVSEREQDLAIERGPEWRLPTALPDTALRINDFLVQHPQVEQIAWAPTRDGTWTVDYIQLGPHTVIEAACGRELLQLAKYGLLDRLRTCICGQWFYAKRRDQKSCGKAVCRQKLCAATEGFKEHRRHYMQYRYAMNFGKDWVRISERKRPTFREWLRKGKPSPEQWREFLTTNQHNKGS
jgi:hypothetical protein